MPRAKAAALRALEIDANLAEAHTSLAMVSFCYEWDHESAERHFLRAIELKPSYSTAHQWYALSLTAQGKYDEAMEQVREARDLDPLSGIINSLVSVPYYYSRRYDEALQQLRTTAELEPNLALLHVFMGYSYYGKRNFGDAIASFERACQLAPGNVTALSRLGFAYGEAGRTDDAERVLSETLKLEGVRHVPAHDLAFIYLGLKREKEALAAVELAVQQRSDYVVYINVDPCFDRLREQRRFTELVRSIRPTERRTAAVGA
jgi:Flp pilus assembly protein TadD